MTCDTCNCFSFWANFCPFAPIAAKKNQNFTKKKKRKEKKACRYHDFKHVPKITIR